MAALGLCTAGLAAAAFVWYPGNESTVEQAIRTDLARQGLIGLGIKVSGREVHLTGTLPHGAQADFAVALARGAVCPNWIGSAPCATRVTARFDGELPTAPREPDPLAPAATQPPASPPPRAAAPSQVATAAPAAAPAPSAAGTVQRSVRGPGCARSLPTDEAVTALEFTIRSASLAASAQAPLDRMARALARCHGQIRIEGHTDTRGDPEANQQLSLARARAVRDALIQRGIAAERLSAVGLGSSQPRFDNATVQGRRKNRRIEWVVVDPAPTR